MTIIDHQDNKESVSALAKEIAKQLKIAIAKNGIAKLLVSGGRSPIPLLKKLSKKKLDWTKVIIGLVDERYVNAEDEASNEKLVKDYLLQNNAREATFFGLIYNLHEAPENLKIAQNIYKKFNSGIDVCILGMGLDGHTASLFPVDEASLDNLINDHYDLLINTQASVAPINRITCSKYLINHANNLYLMIGGKEKLAVLDRAEREDLPIAHFFTTPKSNLIVYYNEI